MPKRRQDPANAPWREPHSREAQQYSERAPGRSTGWSPGWQGELGGERDRWGQPEWGASDEPGRTGAYRYGELESGGYGGYPQHEYGGGYGGREYGSGFGAEHGGYRGGGYERDHNLRDDAGRQRFGAEPAGDVRAPEKWRERGREGRESDSRQADWGPEPESRWSSPGERPFGSFGPARRGGYGSYRGTMGSGFEREGEYGPSSISSGWGPRTQGIAHSTGPTRGPHAGRGPRGYSRSDERLTEDVCERLMEDDRIDASDVSVRVEKGVVRLEGSVESRAVKHRVEDLVDSVLGVRDVANQLKVGNGRSEPHVEAATPTTASSGSRKSRR